MTFNYFMVMFNSIFSVKHPSTIDKKVTCVNIRKSQVSEIEGGPKMGTYIYIYSLLITTSSIIDV